MANSMSRGSHSSGPVPAFAKQLTPYIKTRDEALKFRRALTFYLQAQVELLDDTPKSHVSLCASHNVVNVKRVPPELGSGLRAQYLKALQANITARKEHGELLNEVKLLTKQLGGSTTGELSGPKGRELQTYLSLLRGRQQKKKIQICQHYLDELNGMEEARSDYLDMEREMKDISVAPQELAVHDNGPGNSGHHPDTLLHELERAVLLSKSQADNEKKTLEELKSQALSKQTGDNVCPRARLKALMRTRDELVQWIEHTLATTGMEDASILEGGQDCGDSDHTEARFSLDVLKDEIEQQYGAYVSARRKLLEAVSSTACSSMKSPSKLIPKKVQQQEPDQSSTDLSIIFPYVYENISPLLKAQKATTVHKSFLSAILSKERWNSGKVFERLQNESHLLPEYPILAREQRFKHAVAALNSRPGIGNSSNPMQTQESEIVTHAEAWAFASGAAHDATKDHIDRQLAIGTEMAQSTEKTLRDIYDTMNQDYDGDALPQGAAKGIEDDIWTADTKLSRNRRVAGGLEKRTKGPWSGLNGKVGVIGD